MTTGKNFDLGFPSVSKTRGLWATIPSPDKNSYCTSANALQRLPVLPQQPMLYTKIQPQSFLCSGEEGFLSVMVDHIWAWQPSYLMTQNHKKAPCEIW